MIVQFLYYKNLGDAIQLIVIAYVDHHFDGFSETMYLDAGFLFFYPMFFSEQCNMIFNQENVI